MQSKEEDAVRTKMESLLATCERQILFHKQKIDTFTASFRLSLESIKTKAQETVQNQANLAKMKADLRQVEDEFVKVLAVKTRKEAKQMATRDSISATKARLEELKKNVEVQRTRRDDYAAIISQQSLALATSAEKTKQDLERKGQIQEAILWYNKVLGFQIEGGQGVRFTFSNINMKNPNEEYSFTIRHANDTYTLLDCDPPLNNIKELIQELNRSNALFKFVRIMREKFEEAAALGLSSQTTTIHQDSCTIAVSAPAFSVSTDRSDSPAKTNEYQIQHGEVNRQVNEVIDDSPAKTNEYQIQHGEVNRQVNEVIDGSESPTKKNQHHIQHGEVNRQTKKANHGRRVNPTLLSPGSASTPRRSSRIKAKN